jgi:hypothetical protein
LIEMSLPELSLEQRRQLIDQQQRYSAWRAADRAFRQSNKGSVTWKRISGRDYLYRIESRTVQKSLGPRSPELEKLKADYVASRSANKLRVTKLWNGINAAAAINRAMGLARVPRIAAKVLRALDKAGLLGEGLFVVGTHALYAYEASSGVVFDQGLLATTDLDVLADVRSRLVLAIVDHKRPGVLAALQNADKSFVVQGDLFRASNDDGYFVDIIRPMLKHEAVADDIDLGGIIPTGIVGLKWLVSAPRFEAIAIAEDGLPVWIPCLDPRAFALHKLWVSKQGDRQAIQRQRDAVQASAVAAVAQLMNLNFAAQDVGALPADLIAGRAELVQKPKPTKAQAREARSPKAIPKASRKKK